MVFNYYVNKFTDFIKKQIIFDLILSIIFFKIIIILINPILELQRYSFKLPKDFSFLSQKTIVIEPYYMQRFRYYYYIVAFLSILFIVNDIYERFLKGLFSRARNVKLHEILIKKYPYDKNKFQYILGLKHKEDSLDFVDKPEWYVIEEDGLFQNVLCTGTIGQGKTIAELVQVLVQMIFYSYDVPDKKLAMLCLDVKGNFYKFVHGFAKECNRWEDVVTIELGGKWKINPLHKPNLSAVELANRMRYVLELFSAESNETYWIDKAEDTLVEIIKVIRIYNKNYVNFEEVHNCGSNDEYRNRMIATCQEMFDKGMLNEEQNYSFISARNYFKNEFDLLDAKAQGFIKSEITRITQPFISTKIVRDTFCPGIDEINFYGFEEVINKGQIVVWKINANKEPKIAKLVAAYLKLDFQKEIMITLEGKNEISSKRIKAIICDEYQEYTTKNDAEFLSQSREARAVTFATTQSYTSIKKTLKNDDITNMLLQNFVNKIWLRTDDEFTVKKIINQTGKEEKEKVSTNITESSKQSRASYSLGRILGKGKNLSSGVSIQSMKEERFDEKFLMQTLDAYKCVAFISNGKQIKRPSVIHLTPMFENRICIKDDQLIFTDDNELIFKSIGEVDIDKIENESIAGLKDSDFIDSTKELIVLEEAQESGLTFHEKHEEIKEKEIENIIPNDLEDRELEVDHKENISEIKKKVDEPERNIFDDIIKIDM
jgi:hypothetical protein